STSVRVKMMAAAAKRVLFPHSAVAQKFYKLLTDIEELGSRRNDIAHGVPTSVNAPTHRGFFLMPSFYSKKSGVLFDGRRPMPFTIVKYAYTSAQILGYALLFREHEDRLREIMQEVVSHCGKQLGLLP